MLATAPTAPPRPGAAWPEWELESDANRPIEQTCHDYWPATILPLPAIGGGLKRTGRPDQLRQRLSKLEDNPALANAALPPKGFVPTAVGDQANATGASYAPVSANSGSNGPSPLRRLKEAPVHWISLGARSDKTYPAKPRTTAPSVRPG